MAKDKTVISIDTLQRRLFEAERAYGSGAKITVDEDLNIEPYNQPDLAEETPEESAKRAERQQKERLEKYTDSAEGPRMTISAEALKARLNPAQPKQATARKDEPSKA